MLIPNNVSRIKPKSPVRSVVVLTEVFQPLTERHNQYIFTFLNLGNIMRGYLWHCVCICVRVRVYCMLSGKPFL